MGQAAAPKVPFMGQTPKLPFMGQTPKASSETSSASSNARAKTSLRGPYPSVNSNVLPWKRQDVSPEERERRGRKNQKEKRRKDRQH